MGDHFLAIDQGGHATRALLFAADGRRLAEATVPVATQRSAAGFVEHDARELAASARLAVERLLTGGFATAGRVKAAGLATQRSSIVCWHRQSGEPLSPVISWQDRRNASWLEQFRGRAAWIRSLTGLPLNPHYGASKLRWCLEHLPAVREAAARGALAVGPLSSFLTAQLAAGRPHVVDPANASRTQLWDPRTGDWSVPLCELFGVSPSLLPRCVPSRHDFGAIATPRGAVPLTVVTGDQSAALFAHGSLDAASICVNVGTGAFLQRSVQGALPELPKLLASVVWSDGAGVTFVLEGTVNGAGAALDWLADQERLTVADLLERMRGLATQVEPPLFLNGVSGIGSPYWVSTFDSRFIGESGAALRCLAVLESVVFLIAVNIAQLATVPPALRRLVVTGGMAANDRFCRSLASVAGIEVLRSHEAEATARGLAWLVAGQPTDWTQDAAGDSFSPEPDTPLLRRFVRWQQALETALPS